MTETKKTGGAKPGPDEATSSPAHAVKHKGEGEKRRWPWIVGAILAVLIAIPLILFGIAYASYDVPEPEEVASKQISTIYASDGETQLARIVPPEGNRSHVSLEEIPDAAENATLAAEDREFWTNSGFSFTGFARAALGQLTGNDSAGGGSTITQQYVKNTLVGNARTYSRKLRELVYSVKMTNEWSKEEILNAYLNTVYYGRNAYGIQAAAKAYFDKPAEDLTVEEGAMLAGMIQAPSALDPANDRPAAEARWNYVLDGLVKMGELDPAERAGMKFPKMQDPANYSPYVEATGANGHIKSRVMDELERIGLSEEDVTTRGLAITTTIDKDVQQNTVDAVDQHLAPLQEDARAAAVTVDPATGAVRGYFGGHDVSGWDYANAPMQTGSTFKIMGLAAALQQGISLDTYYSSAPFQLPGSQVVTNADGNTCGTCSIKEATKQSLNTSFLRLQDDLRNKTQDTADMAHALGVAKSLPGIEKTLTEKGKTPYEGIILGQYQSRPLDMATAMATLTNRGIWHETHFVQKVEAANGDVLYENPEDAERRVSSQVSDNVLEAMRPVAARSNTPLAGGRESASKTGTSQMGDSGMNKDAWMVGSTPQLATAVWVGTADGAGPIFTASGGNMYGSREPARIWKQILDASLADAEYETFPTAYPVRYGTVVSSGGMSTGPVDQTPDYSGESPVSSGGYSTNEQQSDNSQSNGGQQEGSQTSDSQPGAPNTPGTNQSGGNGNGFGSGNGNPNQNPQPSPQPQPNPQPSPPPNPQPNPGGGGGGDQSDIDEAIGDVRNAVEDLLP